MPEIKTERLTAFYNSSPTQYFIPPYQRTITWPQPQWKALWEDISNLTKDNALGKTHLLQMFQLQGTVSSGKLAIGDGQQRFVHTSLILMAISCVLEKLRDNPIYGFSTEEKAMLNATSKRILPDPESTDNGMLSFYREGKREAKLVVAPSNRVAYNKIIMKEYNSFTSVLKDKCIVQHAFEFYCNAIEKFLLEISPITASFINNKANLLISAIENRLVFAVVFFESSEEMQASYETTNSKSVPLTQSELIKNHIFKHFTPLDTQERLVENYWTYFDSNYWINKDLGDRNLYHKTIDRTQAKDDKLNLIIAYHLVARIGSINKNSNPVDKPIFNDFKSFYEGQTQNLHHSLPLGELSLDSRNELAKFYENLLKRLKNEAELYYKLENKVPDESNIFYKRAQLFHQRIIKSCKVPYAHTILFSILDRGIPEDQIEEFLSLIESFAIRKFLSKEKLSTDYLLKMSLPYVASSGSIDLKKMKIDLSKNDTKFGSLEGNDNILHYQAYHEWGQSEHAFAAMIISEYENSQGNIKSGISPAIFHGDYTLEHFMPQNPVNAKVTWPLEKEDPTERKKLTFNLGNFALLPPQLNNSFGNKSYTWKKAALKDKANGSGSLGMATLDYMYKSATWDKKQIDSIRKKILNSILAKYSGPAMTITRYGCSVLLVDGKLESDEKIYVMNANGDIIATATVHPDGSMFYDGNSYSTFNTLTKAAYPKNTKKNYLEVWRKYNGNQYIALKDL